MSSEPTEGEPSPTTNELAELRKLEVICLRYLETSESLRRTFHGATLVKKNRIEQIMDHQLHAVRQARNGSKQEPSESRPTPRDCAE